MKSCLQFGALVAVVGMVLVSISPANAAAIRDYELDDGSGTTAADSASGVNGTLTNFNFDSTSGWTAGPFGDGALQFDGSNDIVTTSTDALGTSYTIAGWIKGDAFSSSSGDQAVFAQYNYNSPTNTYPGRFLFGVKDGKLDAFDGSGAGHIQSATSLSSGQWYYVAMTNSNKSVTGYVNGNRAFSGTFTNDAATGGAYNTLGALQADHGGNSGFFGGAINNLKVYDTALTQLQVRALQAPPALRKWALNDSNTTGTTAADASGNAADGTLVNFNNTADSGWGGKRSLHFDGTNDYVAAGSNALGSSYTVTAWIKGDAFAPGSDGENMIFSQYSGAAGRLLFEVRDGKLCAFSGGTGAFSGSTLQANKWYFVALTNANKSVRGYLNAAQDFTATFNSDAPNVANLIGAGGTDWGFFDGYIEDVRVHNFAMNATQLQQVYAPPAYRHYAMKETGSTTTASDAQGNQDGTLQNYGSPGWTGRALRFNGTNNAVAIGSGTVGSAFTVSGWIKGSSFTAGDDNVIFSQYDNASNGRFGLEVRDGKLDVFSGGNYGHAAGSTLNPNQWYYVSVTNDNKKVVVYLNGQRDFSATFNSDAPASANVIGAYRNSVTGQYEGLFNGLINNLQIYDSALTEGQVNNLYTTVDTALLTVSSTLSAGTTNLLKGGRTTLSATIGSADGGGIDTMDWTVTGGSSGNLAAGGTATGTATYTGGVYGLQTATATVTATNHTIGGVADGSGASASVQINVGYATADASGLGKGHYGAALTATVGNLTSYYGLESTVNAGSGNRGTVATILGGANSTGADKTPSMEWRTRTADEAAPGKLISDVVNLSGMVKTTGHETDPFVFQMSYDPSLLVGGDEAQLIAGHGIVLASNDSDVWRNAVLDNVAGNTPIWDGNVSFASLGYTDDDLQLHLGEWGIDTSGGQHLVWAIVDHNSEFAVTAVPEPGTLALLAAGLLGFAAYTWRKHK